MNDKRKDEKPSGSLTEREEDAEQAGLRPEREQNTEHTKAVSELRKGLELLGRLQPSYTPPLAALQAQLEDARRKHRARMLRELGALWSAGVVLLGGSYLLLDHAPTAFVLLQAAAAVAPLLLLLKRKKGADSHEA